jgi:hypothetical protein
MAWGQRWPHLSQGTISASEMSDVSGSVHNIGPLSDSEVTDEPAAVTDESAAVTDESATFTDVDPFSGDLCVPPLFHYQRFGEMQALKKVLGGPDTDNVLVVLKEYEILYKELEKGRYQRTKSIVVLGHPGTGSYGSWL